MKKVILILVTTTIIFSCKKKTETPVEDPAPTTTGSVTYGDPDSVWTSTGSGPHLIFKFKFDSTQIRLDNFGNPSPTIPSGRAAYSPVFNKMAAHYIELAQGDLTALGAGKVLYHAPETNQGGSTAIQFKQSVVVKENVVFYSTPINSALAGTYKWLRLSLSYQNYTIPFKANTYILSGTIASFLGYQTYVERYKIKNQYQMPTSNPGVNGPYANHPQGYWGLETYIPILNSYQMYDGQAPGGATTVVNPNFANSPIPAGSCVVTSVFTNSVGVAQNLTITGNETNDIIITVSVSTNKSFEWTEVVADGYYEPAIEIPIDMGVRGIIPKVQY